MTRLKSRHLWIIIGQALTIIFLATVIIWPRLNSYLFTNADGQISTNISTHFYVIEPKEFTAKLSTPWVQATSSGGVLALSGDNGYDPNSDILLGAKDPVHTLYELEVESKSFKPIATLNFYEAVFGSRGSAKNILHRTLDFVVNPHNKDTQIHDVFISFSSSSALDNCRHLNIIRAKVPKNSKSPPLVKGELFFQSECFPRSTNGDFRLHQSGGRIVFDDSDTASFSNSPKIYISVGDFSKLRQLSSSLASDSHKQLTSILELSENSWQVVADGFRNPQGLALVRLAELGKVLVETEHGPRGGDELNIVSTGSDYGWPSFSYGTAYEPNDTSNIPENEGTSGDLQKPLFSWVPSIAPSQLLQVTGQEFQEWWSTESDGRRYGDLLVSTLKDESLHRLRIENGIVSYSERIFIGERIRSFSQLPSGKLLIGTDSGKILLLELQKSWSSEIGNFKLLE